MQQSQSQTKLGHQEEKTRTQMNQDTTYSKTCVKRPLSKRQKIVFQAPLLLNADQKYCRMLQGEHSAILSTFIELPFVIKIFVLSIFEWQLRTGLLLLNKQEYKNTYVQICSFLAQNCKYFLTHQFQHVFWVLKRAVALRLFF